MKYPMNTFRGEGNSQGKIISIERKHYLISESFFQAAISFLVYVSSSSRHIFFRRNYLFTVSTSSEQPLFHINFYDSYFFVAAISLEQLLF